LVQDDRSRRQLSEILKAIGKTNTLLENLSEGIESCMMTTWMGKAFSVFVTDPTPVDSAIEAREDETDYEWVNLTS